MLKILFVCLGNICRSPMAEFVMKDMALKNNLELYIESAATCSEEIGNPVYPPVKKLLSEHGIDCSGKTARKISKSDYERFDLIVGMEMRNIRDMEHICGGDPECKMRRLLDYTDSPRDLPDPWYTHDFQSAWDDINEGCRCIIKSITENKHDNS